MEDGITTRLELWPRRGAMHVDDDIRRIQQNNQVLREIAQRVHFQVLVRQQVRWTLFEDVFQLLMTPRQGPSRGY